MYTDAELAWYQAGCMIRQPSVEPGHPEIDLFSCMADPHFANGDPAEARPPWIPEEEEEEG
jgi:hypothetical protein